MPAGWMGSCGASTGAAMRHQDEHHEGPDGDPVAEGRPAADGAGARAAGRSLRTAGGAR